MTTPPANAVSWDQLRDYPGSRYRIYSAPLGVERFGFIISRQPPGTEAALHAHDDAEEVYVLLRGQGRMRLGDELLEARQFDAFRAPPGMLHANLNDSDEEIYWLVLGAPIDEFVAESDWYRPGSTSGLLTPAEPAGDGYGPDRGASARYVPPSPGPVVRPDWTPDAPHGAVAWEGLKPYPGYRYRIYSAPLGVEHLAFIISRQPPGAEAVLHAHDDAEEIYVLLNGEGQIRLGDEIHEARPFDAFRAAPGVLHANLNPSGEEIHWLVMAAPPREFVGESDWYRPGSQLGRVTAEDVAAAAPDATTDSIPEERQ